MKRSVHNVRVRLGTRTYTVQVCSDGVGAVADALRPLASRAVVVTDANVRRLVWPRIAAALRRRGVVPQPPVVVPSGEHRKNLRTWSRLHAALLRRGLERSGCVVALGGGVVLDLGGFAAATYMRGVDWIAVPTTLLGMVDAAIGGKVGVDFGGTKNLVGAFHQPCRVIAGTDFLASLPRRQRSNGLAEVVKYAMIADRSLFTALERRPAAWLQPHPHADAALVARCCRIKARVVCADEREAGTRAVLNFGHTIGHALEGDGRNGLLHGEAVGLGMLVACRLAEDAGLAREPLVERLRSVLWGLALPVVPARVTPLPVLRRRWRRDKKARAGLPRFVLTPRIGAASVGHRITEPRVVQALRVMQEPRRAPTRDRIRRLAPGDVQHRGEP